MTLKNYFDDISLEQYKDILKLAQKLTAQHDIARLCDIILDEASRITGADGGTLYLVEGVGDDTRLEFAIVHNHSLGLRLGGASGASLDYPAIPLQVDGRPNHHHVASHAGLAGTPVNIADVYQEEGYDFSGTREFDDNFGYRTCSIFTLPLMTADGELVAVLQLLNATDGKGEVVPFASSVEPVVMALADFAAIAVQQQRVIHDQKELLVALSGEPNTERLLERILNEAKAVTRADGGTLYLMRGDDKDTRLDFALLRNDSLGISQGGSSAPVDLPPIRLYQEDATENHHHVAAHAALSKEVVNIPDAYTSKAFDFSGTQAFDAQNGYRSTSFLTIPLLNHTNDVIGVLQLVNAHHPKTGEVVAFSEYVEPLAKALASYAAIALNNQLLVAELKDLLDAFIKVIAAAIDAKSPHTSAHCQRVPVLTELIAKAACDDDKTFADFHFDEDEWYELHVAAWMHDCGKLATPDSVLDKATKLHSLHDRIETVATRIAALKQQTEVEALRAIQKAPQNQQAIEAQLEMDLAGLDDDLAFLRASNKGGEFVTEENKARIRKLAGKQWRDAEGALQPLLTEDEIYNLCIERGTLNDEERQIINNHVSVSIDMLSSLPFPQKLKRVPEYAGGHHERMDGSGFPLKLTREQMSIPARMMAVADIYEALTAKDRPYKDPMKVSKSLAIMQSMRDDNHIDPDIYELFLRHRVWETYAKQALAPEQLDVTDPTPYF